MYVSKKHVLTIALAMSVLSSPLISQASPTTNPSKTGTPTGTTAHAPLKIGNPKSIELNERGVVAVKSRDFKLAENLFKQALAADPLNITAVYNLSGVYVTQKKEAAAIVLLNDVTARYASDPELFVRLGDAYFSSRKPIDAIRSYEQALALDSQLPAVNAKLGTLYALQNNLSKAETHFGRAVTLNPHDAQALSNYSSVLLSNNKAQDAIRVAKNALQIKVTSDTYVTLGNAYEVLKDHENARISFEKALALGNQSPGLEAKIKSLKVG
jgi:tetratricopeptide (TPR) repeat protein